MAKDQGSFGVRPKSIDFSSRDAPMAPGSPMARPITLITTLSRSTIQST